MRCPRCQLVFYGGYADVDVDQIYRGQYFNGDVYRGYVEDGAIFRHNFRSRIRHLQRLVPAGRLLEIGSAYGFFLDEAKRYWDVKGIELSPEGAEYARSVLSLDVACGDFLDLPDERNTYDIICMWDTIEHLKRPAASIAKASAWLKSGGYLVVTTGDIGSMVARLRRSRWRLVQPPVHLYYFSRATLRKGIEQAGLEIEDMFSVGQSRSLGSMIHGTRSGPGARRRLVHDGVARTLRAAGLFDMPVYLNLFDIMLAVARKSATDDSLSKGT